MAMAAATAAFKDSQWGFMGMINCLSADYRIHADDVLAVLGDTAALEAMQKL